MGTWPKNPTAYLKAIVPLTVGIGLAAGGHIAHDAVIVNFGYGAIAAGLAALGIPNKESK